MSSLTAIAGSALGVYDIRQAVTAGNVANLESAGFTASEVVTREKSAGGVSASVRHGNDRVELSKEAVDLSINANGYKANVKILKTADEMTKELLHLTA